MKRLKILNRWMSEEEGTQIKKDDEQSEQDEDENGSVVVVEDDNEENNMEDGGIEDQEEEEEEDKDNTASIPEELSLLTVVQLKERLRGLGLPVSGRKQELIDRLNDYFKVQDGDE